MRAADACRCAEAAHTTGLVRVAARSRQRFAVTVGYLLLESLMNAEARALSRLSMPALRPVVADDTPQLLRLCAEHAEQIAFERLPHGRARHDSLELLEALFEPPLRAWAWLLHSDDEAVGYAAATVGFSMLERAYYLQLEPWYVRAAMAREWRRPAAAAAGTGPGAEAGLPEPAVAGARVEHRVAPVERTRDPHRNGAVRAAAGTTHDRRRRRAGSA